MNYRNIDRITYTFDTNSAYYLTKTSTANFPPPKSHIFRFTWGFLFPFIAFLQVIANIKHYFGQ